VEPADGGLLVAGHDPNRIGRLALDRRHRPDRAPPAVAELEDVFLELTAGGGIG
jgi:hypothetical protein